MEELSEEVKTMIHHVLVQHKFYHLDISNYHELLHLLRSPQTDDPRLIQQNIFKGIVTFNMVHKYSYTKARDQIGPVLANPMNAHISMQMKVLLHRIMHEFHFLNSIRAYELFQERFQQPAAISEPHRAQGLPFDDQFQKARLHYMYYGPYSVYHMGGMMQQPLSMPYTQPYFNSSNLLPTDKISSLGQSRPLPVEKDLVLNRIHSSEKGYVPTRGRPPKQKKRQLERLIALRISLPLKNYLLANHRAEYLLEERDEDFQHCICRGFLISRDIFTCSQCNNNYHSDCCKFCLGCFLRDQDPFNKVVENIGLFYVDWWGEQFSFEGQLNVKSFERVCSTGRFQIMVSCITPKENEITWPDGAVFSINGQEVFQVPPLLVDHAVSRRKDTAHFITPYVFRNSKADSSINFEKLKISLTANSGHNPLYRDNRKGIFLLGVFLVEKVPLDDLMTSIIEQSRSLQTICPLVESNNRSDIHIVRLPVSCYDPYSKELIETPVRGRNCQHFNCFDLQTFLTFQQHFPEHGWKCPLCAKDARKLVVDKFQLRVIEEIRDLPRLPARLIYHQDGKIDLEEAEPSEGSDEESF